MDGLPPSRSAECTFRVRDCSSVRPEPSTHRRDSAKRCYNRIRSDGIRVAGAERPHSMISRVIPAAAFLVLLATAPLARADDGGPTVLCYHIVESPTDPRMEVSREQFRQQMRYLAVTGSNVIPLKWAGEFAAGK